MPAWIRKPHGKCQTASAIGALAPQRGMGVAASLSFARRREILEVQLPASILSIAVAVSRSSYVIIYFDVVLYLVIHSANFCFFLRSSLIALEGRALW